MKKEPGLLMRQVRTEEDRLAVLRPSAALGGVAVAALLLQGGIHLAAMGVTAAGCKLFHAQAGGTPFNDFDFHHAAPPLAHEGLAGLVDINGGGAYQGAAVVVYHIGVRLALDFEFGAQRVHGPVGSSAAHALTILQVGADGILGTIADVVALRVRVGGGAYDAVELAGMVERESVLVAPQVGEPTIRHSGAARGCRRDEATAGDAGVVGRLGLGQPGDGCQSQRSQRECLFEDVAHGKIQGEMISDSVCSSNRQDATWGNPITDRGVLASVLSVRAGRPGQDFLMFVCRF